MEFYCLIDHPHHGIEVVSVKRFQTIQQKLLVLIRYAGFSTHRNYFIPNFLIFLALIEWSGVDSDAKELNSFMTTRLSIL